MFPLLRDSAARAIDLAIEFATLGEYRLASPAGRQIAPAGPALRGARRVEPAGRRAGAPVRSPQALPALPAAAPARVARLVVPGTRAAQLAQAPPPDPVTRVELGAVVPPPHADTGRLRPLPARRAARTRAGAVDQPVQPCKSPRR
jgi:hypothetical protein